MKTTPQKQIYLKVLVFLPTVTYSSPTTISLCILIAFLFNNLALASDHHQQQQQQNQRQRLQYFSLSSYHDDGHYQEEREKVFQQNPPNFKWTSSFNGTLKIYPMTVMRGGTKDLVFFGAGSHVYAISKTTGKLLWQSEKKYNLEKFTYDLFSPFYHPGAAGNKQGVDQIIFVTKNFDLVVSVSADSGKELWTYDACECVYGYPTDSRLVLTSVRNAGDGFYTKLISIDLQSVSGTAYNIGGAVGSSTVATRDTNIVITGGRHRSDNYSVISARRLKGKRNFEIIWNISLPNIFVSTIHLIAEHDDAMAVIMADYYDGSNVVIVLDTQTGKTVWTDHGKLKLGGFLGSNGTVVFFAGTDANTSAVDVRMGATLWNVAYQPDYMDFMSVSFHDGLYAAYVGPEPKQNGFPFSIYEQSTGKLLTRTLVPYPGEGAPNQNPTPVFNKEHFYFMCEEGVYGARIDTHGTIAWMNLSMAVPISLLLAEDRELIVSWSQDETVGLTITAFDV